MYPLLKDDEIPSDFSFNVRPLNHADNVLASAKPSHMFVRDDMSEDQALVYDQVLAWDSDVNASQTLKLGGYAGTGKTTVLAAIANTLENDRGKHVAYAAFTGKAVNVMSKKLKACGVHGQCMTLHSLMYKPLTNSKGEILDWIKVESLPYSMVVVDEASMVGTELWNDLLSYGLPVLAVGDHGQLPPISESTLNLMTQPDLRLERIHRQAEGNPILELAQFVRNGGNFKKFEPSDSRVSFIPSIDAIAGHLSADANNRVAICYTNKIRTQINAYLRDQQDKLAVGETIICLKNRKPIFNGMRGALSYLDTDIDKFTNVGAVVDFVDDNLRLVCEVNLHQFGMPSLETKLANIPGPPYTWQQVGMLFDYGRAMTCHKSQGSQFKEVAVVFENALYRDVEFARRWMYTAVTRASEKVYLVR
jgi:exodeoxyribonuclease-5